MLEFRYINDDLTNKQIDDIWELVCKCDNEFIPPLSSRESSSQKKLDITLSNTVLPVEYFKELIKQKFVLVIKENKVIAFLSFKVDYICEELNNFGVSNYITTICVEPSYRNQGILKSLYTFIENDVKNKMRIKKFSTRTWSTNDAQINVLERINYDKLVTLKNHRGNGIDTIYFGKEFINSKEV